MAKTFRLEIITPEKVVYSKEIQQVTLPTPQGEITVLPQHVPLVSSVAAGELKIVDQNGENYLAISGGLLQVDPAGVRILADSAERVEEIDVARAEVARQRAIELIKEKKEEKVDYTALAAKLEKELTRLRVARRRHHRAGPTPSGG